MNSVSIIGTGYVGLVTGTCLSEFGLQVICMDTDASKIRDLKQGQSPIYEPGLSALIAKNIASGRLTFTTDMAAAVAASSIIILAVPTPPSEDGSADLQHVLAAADFIAQHMTEYRVIVNKSTV
ncbi:MAG: UDP-glucose/GDP-mannose dehydrogenase family protein, partial [Methanomassiliicoccus sp.]